MEPQPTSPPRPSQHDQQIAALAQELAEGDQDYIDAEVAKSKGLLSPELAREKRAKQYSEMLLFSGLGERLKQGATLVRDRGEELLSSEHWALIQRYLIRASWDTLAESYERSGGDLILAHHLGIPKDCMDAIESLAGFFYCEEDFRNALSIYTFLTTLDPEVAGYWTKLGIAWQQLGEYDHALSALSCSIACDGFDVLTRILAAQCATELHLVEDARTEIAAARKLATEDKETNWVAYIDAAERAIEDISRQGG